MKALLGLLFLPLSVFAQEQYVVLFKPGTPAHVEHEARSKAQVEFTYRHAVRGFAGRIPEQALNGLRHNPNVQVIEPYIEMRTSKIDIPASWGLDRTDQRSLPLSQTYSYNLTGAGTTVYVIDTGIRTSHSEFAGRASWGYDFTRQTEIGFDCNGHGTHVAGTIGGVKYGIAKDAKLVAVKVLDCEGSGTTAGVIAGIDWVTGQNNPQAVANLSLGGGTSFALDSAIRSSIASGVTHVVAAGNEDMSACLSSPARVAEAITVGATRSNDYRAPYSNYGTCLDIFAPGSSITSAWYWNDSATETISGTSMAAPHVAGVAAILLERQARSPAELRQALVSNSTKNVVRFRGPNSPNRLLYKGPSL